MLGKAGPANTARAPAAAFSLAWMLALLSLTSCAGAGPTIVPPSGVESLVPQAVPLCLAALEAPAIPGRSASSAILSLHNKAHEGEEWLHGPRAGIHVADESEAGRAAGVQTLLRIRERREESRVWEYSDEEPACAKACPRSGQDEG